MLRAGNRQSLGWQSAIPRIDQKKKKKLKLSLEVSYIKKKKIYQFQFKNLLIYQKGLYFFSI